MKPKTNPANPRMEARAIVMAGSRVGRRELTINMEMLERRPGSEVTMTSRCLKAKAPMQCMADSPWINQSDMPCKRRWMSTTLELTVIKPSGRPWRRNSISLPKSMARRRTGMLPAEQVVTNLRKQRKMVRSNKKWSLRRPSLKAFRTVGGNLSSVKLGHCLVAN